MQTNHSVDQIVPLASDEKKVDVMPPVELETAQLSEVGGGLATTSSTDAPKGTW